MQHLFFFYGTWDTLFCLKLQGLLKYIHYHNFFFEKILNPCFTNRLTVFVFDFFWQHFKRILRHVSLYTILGTCWVLFMAQNIFNFCQVFTLGIKKSLIGQYFLFLYALYLWYHSFVSHIRRPRKSTEIKFYCNKSMFRFKILQLMKVCFVQFLSVGVQ